MKITVDLPKGLLREAMQISGEASESETVISALVVLIRESQSSNLRDFKGKVDLDIDLDVLRKRK